MFLMKKFRCWILAAIPLLSFLGCSTTNHITYSWRNDGFKSTHAYKMMFVAALVNNAHMRTHLEEEMGIAAAAEGFTVHRSWDYFPQAFSKKDPPSRDTMIEKIRELGCDLIFTITLVDKQSESRYVPGGIGMGGLYGPFPAYGMRFRGFYSYWYPYFYDPGYYVTDKTYLMEGNIFDAADETLIWSVQTESINPPSTEKFTKELVKLMMDKAAADLKTMR